MSSRGFVGGPRHGDTEPVLTAVPSQRIPVFADPPSGAVCADEQVIVQLGEYVRAEIADGDLWQYQWSPK